MKKFEDLFNEVKSAQYSELYFKSYSDAMTFAHAHAIKKGYVIDEDSWFSEVNMGPKKPAVGKTNSVHVSLLKSGKMSRQKLHIQVYNRGSKSLPYELNKYIS